MAEVKKPSRWWYLLGALALTHGLIMMLGGGFDAGFLPASAGLFTIYVIARGRRADTEHIAGAPDEEGLLTPDQVAEQLGMPVGAVYNEATRGGIPYVRVGRGWGAANLRFKQDDVDAWLGDERNSRFL